MTINSALEDFSRARRKATIEQLLSRFTGQSADLLSFEEVRRSLKANRQVDIGLRDVPLDAIVGSVGRYRDFTRTFMPKETTNDHRWARVMFENTHGSGLPPIELYKIGDAYFVLDGNHRVSVARGLEAPTIQAYVKEVVSKVPFTIDMDADKLIIASQYVEFVEQTKIDDLRPQADLQVTAPGKYELLLDHIETHRYFMGIDEDREIGWEEAVAHWYDVVYLPVIDMIRRKGIMRDFSERTETDFYIWLADHRADLEESLGWELSTVRVIDALAEVKRPLLSRVNDLIWETLVGDDDVPLATQQRWEAIEQTGKTAEPKRATENIMVNIDGDQVDWTAVAQAILIAQREQSSVHALYFPSVTAVETEPEEIQEQYDQLLTEGAAREEVDTAVPVTIRKKYQQMLLESGVRGQIAVAEGNWQRSILNRSRWNDILVLGVGGSESALRQRPWRQIVTRSARPVLLVPDQVSALDKILLAYDGRKYAIQSLSISAYLANHWGIPLVVVIIGDDEMFARLKERADAYLSDHGVAATFVQHEGDVATNILLTAEEQNCDVVVMGTYSYTPIMEMIRGTAVNIMLSNAPRPILICQ